MGKREPEEGGLQALPDQDRRGSGRLRRARRGPHAAVRAGAGAGDALPDLVLIDGGRGQLNVGLKVLQDLGLDYLPVVALAKQQEEVYVGESLHPLSLDPTSPALHALQKVRDEAHRFAITYHKKLRSRRTLQSVLDTIPGVGPTIRTSLLKTLGSARRVRESSVAELAAVPKVTPRLAQRIFDHFHPQESMEPEHGVGG